MRADRLLSILMLLQARGRVTAHQLAEELEVSERTIYRDIDALSGAGVPVYAVRGLGGGYALLDSYRTNLTGLTQNEVRALFMLNIPSVLNELGVNRELKAALLKLSAALPASRREDEANVRRRIHLDSQGWDEHHEPVPHLRTVHEAIWRDRKLSITLRLPFEAQSEWVVDPYGLVAKANHWYVVFARKGRIRARPVSQILDAHIEEGSFERPDDFDLAAFWQSWSAEEQKKRVGYRVRLRAVLERFRCRPGVHLGAEVREALESAGPPDARGCVTFYLTFENLEEARKHLLGYGRALEVLEPKALRLSMLDYASRIVDLYGQEGPEAPPSLAKKEPGISTRV